MKKILTIALVAVLAATSVFAGVNFSGRFRQGYKFTFAEGKDVASTAWRSNEAKFVIKASDDNGIWTISLKDIGALDSNDKWAANASVSLTKLLAAAGVDTGDFSLDYNLGNNDRMAGLSAYNDVTASDYCMLNNDGTTSFELAAAYGKLVKFNIAVDPTVAPASVTAGSGFVFDSETGAAKPAEEVAVAKKEASTVISIASEPVDGISVAAGYAYNGWIQDATDAANNSKDEGFTDKHMIGASVKADIAKLADLDFKLSVSAYDNYAVKGKINSFAANIASGVDTVDGYVEFAMKNTENKSVYALNTKINFNVVENLGLDAYFKITNIEKTSDTFKVGADVSYKLSGVQFALNAEYARAKKEFTVTPKMIIAF